jgi:SMI1 / KNR4 family (SUKH-1)
MTIAPGFPDHLISFSRDGAGNFLCFDSSKNIDPDDPEIVLWNVNAQPGTGKEVSFVSKNFSALLVMLFKE